MNPQFKNIGLIGLGLIGSSLARVIRKNRLAERITGHTKPLTHAKKALELGIIDNIAASNAEIAASCDLVIISTPLLAYDNIFHEIHMEIKGRNCLITDVGSLKFPVITIAERYLESENLKYFVPAHPIAGTEKTGVEAGFAELFANKKTILTPTINTLPEATAKITKFWSDCGSKVEALNADLHDMIYAEVSHLPQFLAYCYALLLLEQNANYLSDLHVDVAFKRFSRICTSDPAIWLDIFMMNKANLATSLDKFISTIQDVMRRKSNISGDAPENDNKTLITTIPAIISAALIESCPHAEQYAGSGFKDFTSLKQNIYRSSYKESEQLIACLISKARELIELIKTYDYKESMALMQRAANWQKA